MQTIVAKNKTEKISFDVTRKKTAHKSHLVKSMQTKFYCSAAGHKHSFLCESGPFSLFKWLVLSMGAQLASNKIQIHCCCCRVVCWMTLFSWRVHVATRLYKFVKPKRPALPLSASCIPLFKVFAFPFFFHFFCMIKVTVIQIKQAKQKS